jgi:predicted transcriptional regulator
MKNNNAFHINFGSLEDLGREARQALSGVVKKENIGRSALFADLNDFMSFMFPGKFMLLMMIKSRGPGSLYELAQLVGRSQSGVLRECKDLEAMGFIVLKKNGARNALKPTLSFDYDRLIVHTEAGESSHILPRAA